jgi:hypothetical protein
VWCPQVLEIDKLRERVMDLVYHSTRIPAARIQGFQQPKLAMFSGVPAFDISTDIYRNAGMPEKICLVCRCWRSTSCARGWLTSYRMVDIRLPGTGTSNSHGARPVYSNQIDN